MGRVINIVFPESLLESVDRLAEKEGKTRSEIIREAVREYLRAKGAKGRGDLLSRLARLATEGPRLSASEAKKWLYERRR